MQLGKLRLGHLGRLHAEMIMPGTWSMSNRALSWIARAMATAALAV